MFEQRDQSRQASIKTSSCARSLYLEEHVVWPVDLLGKGLAPPAQVIVRTVAVRGGLAVRR